MTLQGTLLIGQQPITGSQADIVAINPATGEALAPSTAQAFTPNQSGLVVLISLH